MRALAVAMLLVGSVAAAQTIPFGGRRSFPAPVSGSTTAEDSVNVGNGTSSVATAIASCSAAGSAVTYNTTTNAFGCNTLQAAITDTLAFANTTTTALTTSSRTDATVTISVPAFTYRPTVTYAAQDMVWLWENNAGTDLMWLDQDGRLRTAHRITSGEAVYAATLVSDNHTQEADNTANGMLIQSTTNTAPTIAGLRFNSNRTLTTNLATNDTIFNITAPDGTTTRARVDKEGDLFITGSLQVTGSSFDPLRLVNQSGNTIYCGVLAANISGTQANCGIRELNTLDANDINFAVSNSAGTAQFSVDHEGDVVAAATIKGTTGLIVGATGTAIASSYRATGVIDFANKVAAGCQDGTPFTTTGAAVGSECIVGAPAAPEANSSFTCFVNAADAVTVRHCCHSANCDPASATYAVRVFNP